MEIIVMVNTMIIEKRTLCFFLKIVPAQIIYSPDFFQI